MDEISVRDDELGFEVDMGDEPTEGEEQEGSAKVANRSVLGGLDPRAWSTPGTP